MISAIQSILPAIIIIFFIVVFSMIGWRKLKEWSKEEEVKGGNKNNE